MAVFTPLLSARETIRVDGVPVYGRIHDVTRADIHTAIADCDDKPAAVEVVGDAEMHAYLRERELGWVPCRTCYPGASAPATTAQYGHPCWGCAGLSIILIPEGLHLIRTADEVYVFPVRYSTLPSTRIAGDSHLNPHGDYKRSRLLGPKARRALVRLLGHEKRWSHAQDSRLFMGRQPGDVGFLFRNGPNKLILFCSAGATLQGPFNGQNTGGFLEEKPAEELENWKKQYVQPELMTK